MSLLTLAYVGSTGNAKETLRSGGQHDHKSQPSKMSNSVMAGVPGGIQPPSAQEQSITIFISIYNKSAFILKKGLSPVILQKGAAVLHRHGCFVPAFF